MKYTFAKLFYITTSISCIRDKVNMLQSTHTFPSNYKNIHLNKSLNQELTLRQVEERSMN